MVSAIKAKIRLGEGREDQAGAGGSAGVKWGLGKAALPRRREQLCAHFGESSPGEGGSAQRWEGNRAAAGQPVAPDLTGAESRG